MDALEAVSSHVLTQKQHQRRIVEKLLQSFQRELVQVVEYFDNIQLGIRIVLYQSEHHFRVDETAKIEDKVLHWDIKPFQILAERDLDVALQELGEVTLAVMLAAHEVQCVEITGIVLAKVTHQILVNNFITNSCGTELCEAELNSILIQRSFRGAQVQ